MSGSIYSTNSAFYEVAQERNWAREPVEVGENAVRWEWFYDEKIAITVLLRGEDGTQAQFYRHEWAKLMTGAYDGDGFSSGELRPVAQPESQESFTVDAHLLEWESDFATGPLIACIVFVEERGMVAVTPLRRWLQELPPERLAHFNLLQW